MSYENPPWVDKILALVNEVEENNHNPNKKAFNKLVERRKNLHGTLDYSYVYEMICPILHMNKSQAWVWLKNLETNGKIAFVGFKGIRIISEDIN